MVDLEPVRGVVQLPEIIASPDEQTQYGMPNSAVHREEDGHVMPTQDGGRQAVPPTDTVPAGQTHLALPEVPLQIWSPVHLGAFFARHGSFIHAFLKRTFPTGQTQMASPESELHVAVFGQVNR